MTESIGGGMPNHLRIQWKLKVNTGNYHISGTSFLLIVGIGCQDLGWCNHSKSGKKLLAVGYEKIDSYFKIFKGLQRFRQFKF